MPQEVTVIGAGVVGLSTAIKAQEAGYNVTIVAECLPGDIKSIHYTSPWAGAHHVATGDANPVLQKMEKETFETMWTMSEPGHDAEGCFLRLPQVEYYTEETVGDALEHMPNFERVSESTELGQFDAKSGFRFTTVTIDSAAYLPYLQQFFLSRGGRVVRAKVQHISQVMDGAFSPSNQPPDAVFVCPGLGARSLGGVEDTAVYPIRGQIVLIRAPWIKFGRTIGTAGDDWTYVIPRRSGDVILGGTKAANDWYPHARPETTQAILERCLALAPELIPPEVREQLADHPEHRFTTKDIEPIIIETGCGLRPARKGGIRLEMEVVQGGAGRKTVVVYNYGHGGYGYQTSWGSATVALDILKGALEPA